MAGADYLGKEDLSGQTFNKYNIDGDIFYWTTTDAKQTPRRLFEDSSITKDFIMNTYSEEYISDRVFALPSYCTKELCPKSSLCGELQKK